MVTPNSVFANLKTVKDEIRETEAPEVAEPTDALGEEGPAAVEPPVEQIDEVAALTAERDRLAGEKVELQDLLIRRQAEFENFRKRSERERIEFAQYAGMELIRDLLPIADDFERALKADSASSEYRKGVELIYQRFFDLLQKAGLEPIEAEGKLFDPNLHQAVDRQETDEVEEHTVLQEYQRGYNYRGRLLRPTMVKVAVKPA